MNAIEQIERCAAGQRPKPVRELAGCEHGAPGRCYDCQATAMRPVMGIPLALAIGGSLAALWCGLVWAVVELAFWLANWP